MYKERKLIIGAVAKDMTVLWLMYSNNSVYIFFKLFHETTKQPYQIIVVVTIVIIVVVIVIVIVIVINNIILASYHTST